MDFIHTLLHLDIPLKQVWQQQCVINSFTFWFWHPITDKSKTQPGLNSANMSRSEHKCAGFLGRRCAWSITFLCVVLLSLRKSWAKWNGERNKQDSAAALENGRAAKHGDLSVGKSSALVSNLDKVPRWWTVSSSAWRPGPCDQGGYLPDSSGGELGERGAGLQRTARANFGDECTGQIFKRCKSEGREKQHKHLLILFNLQCEGCNFSQQCD